MKYIFILLLLLSIANVFFNQPSIENSSQNNVIKPTIDKANNIISQSITNMANLSNSGPFLILNNSQLIDQATIHNWPGNGTKSNPIIIENLIINESISNVFAFALENTNLNVIIMNNTVSSYTYGGFNFYNVSHAIITNNTAINTNEVGFTIQNCFNMTVTDNYAKNNKDYGFSMILTKNTTLSNNYASQGTFYIESYNKENNTIYNNYISGLPLIFYNSGGNYNIATQAGEIILIDVNNVTISDQIMNSSSFLIFHSKSLNILNNTFFGNKGGNGIYLYNSSMVNIYNNTILNINTGILESFVNDSITSNNLVANCSNTGIGVSGINNSIVKNKVIGNYYGIFNNGFNNSIIDNYAENNGLDSIYIGSANSTVRGNIVINSENGIEIHSYNTTIFNNTAINNNKGIYLYVSTSVANNNFILNNTLFNNYYGFYAWYSKSNYIEYNYIINSTNYGAYFFSGHTQDNVISNYFIDNNYNNLNSSLQVSSFYVNFNLNYFSDWLGPDANNDGIVDSYYKSSICCYAPIDYNPINKLPFTLNYSVITSLTNGMILNPFTNITWNLSNPLLHIIPATYSLFYSVDNGTTWISIANSLQNDNYLLNVTSIDCSVIKLKLITTYTNSLKSEYITGNLYHDYIKPPVFTEITSMSINQTYIKWNPAIDSLNNSVNYYLYYSTNRVNWYPLESSNKTDYTWNTTLLNDSKIYYIKLFYNCTNGLNGSIISNNISINNLIHEITPISLQYSSQVNNVVEITWNKVNDSYNHTISYYLFIFDSKGNIKDAITSNFNFVSNYYYYYWNTSSFTNGTYIIKLLVNCSNGLSESIYYNITITNIISPNTSQPISTTYLSTQTVLSTSSSQSGNISQSNTGTTSKTISNYSSPGFSIISTFIILSLIFIKRKR